MALPPPTLTMQSAPRSRANAAPASTMWTPESGTTSEKTPTQESPSVFSIRPGTSVLVARTESVTITARAQPRARTSSLTSFDEPEPKTTRVVFMKMNERLES
jgi:hypothetical protein